MLHVPPITTAHRLSVHLSGQHHTRSRTTQLAAMRVLGHPLTDVSTRHQYPEQCRVLGTPAWQQNSAASLATDYSDLYMAAPGSNSCYVVGQLLRILKHCSPLWALASNGLHPQSIVSDRCLPIFYSHYI